MAGDGTVYFVQDANLKLITAQGHPRPDKRQPSKQQGKHGQNRLEPGNKAAHCSSPFIHFFELKSCLSSCDFRGVGRLRKPLD